MKTAFDQLLCGDRAYIPVGSDVLPEKLLLYPGSFNPLHAGHEGLLRAAEKISGRGGWLELSVANVDKPPLNLVEVERRLLQLHGRFCAVLTCAPTFLEKARLFPGAWFALGYDTAVRLLSSDYHADISGMLAEFQALETRFVVAGRLYAGRFQSLEHLIIPKGYEALFIPVPEALFRADISSTELRGSAL